MNEKLSKLVGSTVEDVSGDFNEITLVFEDGSQLHLEADGPMGTKLKAKLTYTESCSFQIV